jgi:deoxyribonuclease-4
MRIGAHMSISGGKYKALEAGKELHCESIQVFIRNIRGWVSKPLEQEEIDKFLEKRKEIDSIWPIITHNSYLINLATTESEKLEKSYVAMLDELTKADQLKLEYANMHPGNRNENEDEDSALNRIANHLNKLIEDTKQSKVVILLETTAGQGNDLGYKFEHMKYLIDNIKDKNRIGICFDTAHSFAAGYDFSTQKKYDEMWDDFDKIIGLKYLFAFHLNDSQKDLGSKVDRHTHIGQGKIGKNPFAFFINDDRFENHPGILETPKGKDMKEDIMNLNILKSLRKK